MTEDGTDEIISTRSKTYQKLNVDIDSLPLQDLYTIIQDNPGLLRRPIILDEKRQLDITDEDVSYQKGSYFPITRSATFSRLIFKI